MFVSRYMPCEDCGESLDTSTSVAHECAPDRLADFQMFALREHIAGFDAGHRAYLHSAHGRFEAWLAARHVRQSL